MIARRLRGRQRRRLLCATTRCSRWRRIVAPSERELALAIDDLALREPARRPRSAAHGPRHGRSLLRLVPAAFRSGSCSTSTTPSTPCTAASSCACSTPITTNTAFSRSSCSTAPAVSSPPCCARPSAPAARRPSASCAACCATSAPTGRRTEILLRADSHYCTPETLDFCRANGLDFILGVAPTTDAARAYRRRSRPEPRRAFEAAPAAGKVRRYKEFLDGAQSWSRVERIIARVEAGPDGVDTRFVVTSLDAGNAAPSLRRRLLPPRPGREPHQVLEDASRADRTSCTKATANQLRLFLHAGAYWIMWGLRMAAPKRSPWRAAQFDTLRLRLVKIAARVVEMKTADQGPSADELSRPAIPPRRARANSTPRDMTEGASAPEIRTHFRPPASLRPFETPGTPPETLMLRMRVILTPKNAPVPGSRRSSDA